MSRAPPLLHSLHQGPAGSEGAPQGLHCWPPGSSRASHLPKHLRVLVCPGDLQRTQESLLPCSIPNSTEPPLRSNGWWPSPNSEQDATQTNLPGPPESIQARRSVRKRNLLRTSHVCHGRNRGQRRAQRGEGHPRKRIPQSFLQTREGVGGRALVSRHPVPSRPSGLELIGRRCQQVARLYGAPAPC